MSIHFRVESLQFQGELLMTQYQNAHLTEAVDVRELDGTIWLQSFANSILISMLIGSIRWLLMVEARVISSSVLSYT